MSSPELEVIQGQVSGLQDEMKGLKLSVSSLQTMEPRMKAVEARQGAIDSRVDHIDRVVMSIQVDLQKLSKTFDQLESQHTKKLDDIHAMSLQLLALLQPKVTL